MNPTTGYVSAPDQLVGAVLQVQNAILAKDWQLTDRVLRTLDSPLVLVRGDLDQSVIGRTFASPSLLSDALLSAPNLGLLSSAGPLQLFGFRQSIGGNTEVASMYATVDSLRPHLRILPKLPDGAALISGPPLPRVPEVLQSPSISDWRLVQDTLIWAVSERKDFSYSFVSLDAQDPQQAVGQPADPDSPTR